MPGAPRVIRDRQHQAMVWKPRKRSTLYGNFINSSPLLYDLCDTSHERLLWQNTTISNIKAVLSPIQSLACQLHIPCNFKMVKCKESAWTLLHDG